MSLPSSESIPNKFEELPPARQRQIRRRPRTASNIEWSVLIDSLLRMTLPGISFYLSSIIGGLALSIGTYLGDPVILIAGAVVFRLIDPLFGLALIPTSQKWRTGIKSFISLIILIVLTFSGGVLSGYLNRTANFTNLTFARFSSPFWLDISLVCAASLLGGIIFVRSGKMPRLLGVLLSYEILVPIALGGFGYPTGSELFWSHALLTGLTYLLTALANIVLIFLILGINPKRSVGWFLLLAVLALAAGSLIGSVLLTTQTPPLNQALAPTTTATRESSPTSLPSSSPSVSPTATATWLSSTSTPTITMTTTMTPTATSTQTPQPTSYWVVIDSQNGAVIRESPKFDAPVVGYLDDAISVEILEEILPEGSSIWYRVRTQKGTTGWLLGSLAKSQTPTPEKN